MRLFLLIILSFFITIGTSFARNQKIAVVNFELIEKDSLAAKDISRQLTERQRSLELKTRKAQEQIDEKVKSFQKSKNKTQAAQEKLQREIMTTEQELQEQTKELDAKKNKALAELNLKIKEISTAIAEDDGYSIVIPSTILLYSSDKLDITKDIIKKLNSEIKSLPLN